MKNLAAKEPSALGLDTYYKQYYLCLAAAAATIKWYFQYSVILEIGWGEIIFESLVTWTSNEVTLGKDKSKRKIGSYIDIHLPLLML